MQYFKTIKLIENLKVNENIRIVLTRQGHILVASYSSLASHSSGVSFDFSLDFDIFFIRNFCLFNFSYLGARDRIRDLVTHSRQELYQGITISL